MLPELSDLSDLPLTATVPPVPQPVAVVTHGSAINATNVLLISDEVQDAQQLVDAANANTFTIVYNVTSTKADVLQVLTDNFPSGIQRIALAFHSSGPAQKLFLDTQYLFSENVDDENVAWLIDVIRTFGVSNIDFLACNTLNYANWTSYFQQLTSATNVVIGASDDRTGNLKYGGDWIMESTKEDIESIYFIPSAIENYQHVFAFPVTVAGVVYSQNGSNASANGFVPGITTAVIQSQITDGGTTYNVTQINVSAFQNANTITSVTIPSTVTTIENNAFFGCSSLTSLTIPSSVTTVGTNVFSNCTSLTSVTIQNAIIGQNMFSSCTGLTSVTIPSSVTTVRGGAFISCLGLLSATIPSSVTSLGNNIFVNCTSLTSITIQNSIIGYQMFAQCASLTSVTIPSTVTDIRFKAFSEINNITVTFAATDTLPTITNPMVDGLSTIAYYKPSVTGNPQQTLLNAGFSETRLSGPPPSNTCFPAGTKIRTDKHGDVAIEKLDKRVHTIHGGHRIEHVTRIVSESQHLVAISAGALGKDMPTRDTRISMNHRVLWRGNMIKARDLLPIVDGVTKVSYSGETLYNVLLESPGQMVSNGMIVETLDPNNGIARLYRDLKFDELSAADKSSVLQRIASMRQTLRSHA